MFCKIKKKRQLTLTLWKFKSKNTELQFPNDLQFQTPPTVIWVWKPI